jgi:hypothetical protein
MRVKPPSFSSWVLRMRASMSGVLQDGMCAMTSRAEVLGPSARSVPGGTVVPRQLGELGASPLALRPRLAAGVPLLGAALW